MRFCLQMVQNEQISIHRKSNCPIIPVKPYPMGVIHKKKFLWLGFTIYWDEFIKILIFQPFLGIFSKNMAGFLKTFKNGIINSITSIYSISRVLNPNLMLVFNDSQNFSHFSAIVCFCKKKSKMSNC